MGAVVSGNDTTSVLPPKTKLKALFSNVFMFVHPVANMGLPSNNLPENSAPLSWMQVQFRQSGSCSFDGLTSFSCL